MIDLKTDLELTNSMTETENLERQQAQADALLNGSNLQFADLLPAE